MNENKERISAYLDKELIKSIQTEADNDNRSFNFMLGYLASQAIKERERTRAKNNRKKQVNEQGA
jgi:hypothetical protein